MSAFSAEWLALREPADAEARAPRLVERLRERTSAPEPRRIIDLGAGTGAALRYLAPRLGGAQRWQLVDADEEALEAGRDELCDWASRRGAQAHPAHAQIDLRGAGLDCEARFVATDLARGFGDLDWPDGSIVCASALLDLVSARWLDELVGACLTHASPAWLALSYDGRIALEPADPLDARLREALNRDQRRDKGFGPALGPAAAQYAAAAFRAAGYAVETERSDWRLDAGRAALAAALLEGYARVGRSTGADSPEAVAAWRVRRTHELADGALRLVVGHLDVLALPPG